MLIAPELCAGYQQVVSNAQVNPALEPIADIVLDARSHGRYVQSLIYVSPSDFSCYNTDISVQTPSRALASLQVTFLTHSRFPSRRFCRQIPCPNRLPPPPSPLVLHLLLRPHRFQSSQKLIQLSSLRPSYIPRSWMRSARSEQRRCCRVKGVSLQAVGVG